jgi:hypothetical protein
MAIGKKTVLVALLPALLLAAVTLAPTLPRVFESIPVGYSAAKQIIVAAREVCTVSAALPTVSRLRIQKIHRRSLSSSTHTLLYETI